MSGGGRMAGGLIGELDGAVDRVERALVAAFVYGWWREGEDWDGACWGWEDVGYSTRGRQRGGRGGGHPDQVGTGRSCRSSRVSWNGGASVTGN